MERIWLKHYPAGVPQEIDPSKYASLVALLDECFAKYRDRKAFICMDKAMTYGELDELSRDFAAYLQQHRAEVRRPRRRDDAEHPAIPGHHFGILRAGMTVVNVNPLYTARELEHQLKDPARKRSSFWRTSPHLGKSAPSTPVKHVILANMGEMLGVERCDRQPGGAQGEEDGAGVPLPGATRSSRRWRKGQARSSASSAGRCRVSAIHGRHDGRVERRNVASSKHSGEHRAVRGLAAAVFSRSEGAA